MARLLNFIAIIMLCVMAAITYGVLHDQVTVRVCKEYFTVGHVPIFGDQPDTVLAILWGTAATWWVGLTLGIFVATLSAAGPAPPVPAKWFLRPLARLMLVMACCSSVAGVVGYFLASAKVLTLSPQYSSRLVATKHAAFLADGCAHNASYLVGIVGGVILARRAAAARRKLVQSTDPPPDVEAGQ